MYWVIVRLLQPYTFLLAVLGVAVFRSRRLGKDGVPRRRRWAIAAWVLLYLISTPAVAYFAYGSLEWGNPPLGERPEEVEAIVVLGGDILLPAATPDRAELGHASLARCRQAVLFYRQGKPCPVLASAGNGPADLPLGELMGRFLIEEGVAPEDVLTECRSLDTYQNAVESARILRERGIRRILLVTDATHLPRAAACFRGQGLEVTPGGASYRAQRWRTSLGKILPSTGALDDFHDVCHEWIGLLWYRLRGRI
jgi:uncharacterized SAM-binding protein YcdF (DUF218 family)